MIDARRHEDPVRRRIEALGTSMSLPTVARALGVLEGEHRSPRRGGTDDLLDVRAYEIGDEARQIDWKISARSGRTMVVQRERRSSSRVHLLLDGGREMTATCPSDERAYAVAANALCMFAALTLRRSDDVSLVLGDASRITRVPFHGGFAQFERRIDEAIDRRWTQPRNLGALLDYAIRLRDRHALVVLATSDATVGDDELRRIRRIAQTHPFVLIDVATVNPFAAEPVPGRRGVRVRNGANGRRVPAFLTCRALADEVATHRAYRVSALRQELSRSGARFIHADSSEAMFHDFVRLISLSRLGTPGARSHLRTDRADREVST